MERVWDIPKFMDPHSGVQSKKGHTQLQICVLEDP